MADDVDGFDGCIEVVQRTRGYRRWPNNLKARIVAESFHSGVRVVDVARRHDVHPHQLSGWRRLAREGLLALPAELMERPSAEVVPSFVPITVADEGPPPVGRSPASDGRIDIRLGEDLVMHVPGDVVVDRVAALVRALRGGR